jgi:hypothetical protein
MCLLRCQDPALAIGTGVNGNDSVYATTTQWQSNGTTSMLVAGAPAATGTFATPFDLADVENAATARRTPQSSALAAGPAPGFLVAAWVAENMDNGLASLGDHENRVRVRVSHDGGATFGPVIDVARPTDAPIGLPPSVSTAAGVVHLVYVTGGLDGVWNVVLATSHDDGSTWAYRVVNDDEPCATHAWASVAADPINGDAHVIFLDNRFGVGEVVYSRCPTDVTQRCSRNELVSGEPFALSTTQDPARWLGIRSSLRFAPDGTLWAGWSDTRTGGPGIYVVRGHPSH